MCIRDRRNATWHWCGVEDVETPVSYTHLDVYKRQGLSHTCGVKVDGSAACWGSNSNGQTNAPPEAFQSISAGYQHSCGVKTDGNVVCWGGNSDGQSTVPTAVSYTHLDVYKRQRRNRGVLGSECR